MSENSATRLKRFGVSALVLLGDPFWVVFSFVFMSSVLFIGVVKNIPTLETFFSTSLGQLATGVIIYALVLIMVVAPFLSRSGKLALAKVLGVLQKPRWDILWLPIAFWAAYMFFSIIVSAIVSKLIPSIDQMQSQDVGFSDISQPLEYILAFVALVVLPPFFEELLFRGYLFGRLRSRFGFWVTTLMVSATFGLVHGQWNVGIDVAVLSVFLCMLREKTGSVWYGMVVHAVKNGLAYFLLFIAPLLGIHLLQ